MDGSSKMITMLRIRRRESRSKAKNGAALGELSLRKRRFPKGHIVSEKYLSKRKPILFTGDSGSGKTKALNRLYNAHKDLHGTRTSVRIAAYDPITAWTDQPKLDKWLAEKYPEDSKTQWRRLEKMVEWIAEEKAIIYIDDMHKLTGRKMHIARRFIDASKLWYGTTGRIERISPTIRVIIDTDKIEIVKFNTKASYDATKPLTFLILLSMAVAGAWEAAIVIGLLTQLSTGRNAIRQD